MHGLQLYRNVSNTDKLIANICRIFCPFQSLYYAVSFSLTGEGKSPLTFFYLLTRIVCVSVNILGEKKEIELSPTKTRETYL